MRSHAVLAGALLSAVAVSARPTSAFAQQRRIYVDPAAPGGGDGRTPETAFIEVQTAVNAAHTATQTVMLVLLPGRYPDKNVLVDVDDMAIAGFSDLVVDGAGLPTGPVATSSSTQMIASTLEQEHIFIVIAQRVQISNVVFRSPNTTVAARDSAIFIDGRRAYAGPFANDFSIYRCRFEGYGAGLVTRLATGRIDSSYFTRNRTGIAAYGGLLGGTIIATRIRAVRNLDAGFTTGPYIPTALYSPVIPTAEAYEGSVMVEIFDNDFSDNGHLDLPTGGTTDNPAGVGLLITSMNTGGETTRPATGYFIIERDRFANNTAYGLAADATLPGTPPGACVANDGQIIGELIPQQNTFVGNGRNSALFSFKTVAETVARAPGCLSAHAVYSIDGPEAATYSNADYFSPYDPTTDPRAACANLALNCLHFELAGTRLSP